MPPEEFEADVERLWSEVKPLYDELHCYVRAKLRAKYGKDKVPEHGPIPTQLLGNMWAQSWEDIYDLVEPYKGEPSLDVSKTLVAKKIDAKAMVKMGESFFTSLGFDPLPATFWERSLFTRPRDREVVCHASAWDVTWSRRPAHQDVHRADGGGSRHDPPRARPRLLLLAVLQAADPLSAGGERRLPRGDRRHDRAQRDARVPEGARPARRALPHRASRARINAADEDGAREGGVPAVRAARSTSGAGTSSPGR